MKSIQTAAEYRYADIVPGFAFEARYDVDLKAYEGFLELSDDRSPIHSDEAEARRRGFDGRVMHGTLLNVFLSHLIGMKFPGRFATLQSVDIQYRRPVYLEDRLCFEATVAQKTDAVRVLNLDVKVRKEPSGSLVASARVQVGMSE